MAGKKYESVLDRRERIAMGEDAGKFKENSGAYDYKSPVRARPDGGGKRGPDLGAIVDTVKQAFDSRRGKDRGKK